ncbi:MAG: nitroreductase family protein [Candidatus Accumulibacter sp.]|jgi:nitroreductase|nr:nitroreductase family protein [Accumulibacter sp.]
MKRSFFATLFLSALAMSVVQAEPAASITLPAPQKTGGKPVLDAVAARASAPGSSGFPSQIISPEELSTLLWAASGKNRPDKWTVPFAQGLAPYVDIYVAGREGIYRYAWQNHTLERVAEGDSRTKINPQGFAGAASHIFIFVSNRTSLKQRNASSQHWAKWTHVATGAMTEQLYLVADSLGIGARYAETMDVNFVRQTLNIPADEEPICIFALGKR